MREQFVTERTQESDEKSKFQCVIKPLKFIIPKLQMTDPRGFSVIFALCNFMLFILRNKKSTFMSFLHKKKIFFFYLSSFQYNDFKNYFYSLFGEAFYSNTTFKH